MFLMFTFKCSKSDPQTWMHCALKLHASFMQSCNHFQDSNHEPTATASSKHSTATRTSLVVERWLCVPALPPPLLLLLLLLLNSGLPASEKVRSESKGVSGWCVEIVGQAGGWGCALRTRVGLLGPMVIYHNTCLTHERMGQWWLQMPGACACKLTSAQRLHKLTVG